MNNSEIEIRINPPPRNIPVLFSDVAALKSKILPNSPTNKTRTPNITLAKLVLVING